MQADWEIEIGGDAPIIDAYWSGFVDLRTTPERISEVVEVESLPGLADALMRLNRPGQQYWSAKCDVWILTEFDPDEMDAPRTSSNDAIACYIDILPAAPGEWREVSEASAWCEQLCRALQASPQGACRADLILRRASEGPGHDALGVTAYISACGSNPMLAETNLDAALAVFAESITSMPRDPAFQKLQ